jgi:hypothetical protein
MTLVHNAVASPYPNVNFEKEIVEIVSSFKYLGVEIRTLKWYRVLSSQKD